MPVSTIPSSRPSIAVPLEGISYRLQVAERLKEDEFRSRVLPTVTRLFSNPDRSVRKELLDRMHVFGPFLPDDVAETKVLPAVLPGFEDQVPLIRELTLKSLLTLAPKVKQK